MNGPEVGGENAAPTATAWEQLQAEGWTSARRWRIRCSGCDFVRSAEASAAEHFGGIEDREGHRIIAESQVILCAPWVAS